MLIDTGWHRSHRSCSLCFCKDGELQAQSNLDLFSSIEDPPGCRFLPEGRVMSGATFCYFIYYGSRYLIQEPHPPIPFVAWSLLGNWYGASSPSVALVTLQESVGISRLDVLDQYITLRKRPRYERATHCLARSQRATVIAIPAAGTSM